MSKGIICIVKNGLSKLKRTFMLIGGYRKVKVQYTTYPINTYSVNTYEGYLKIATINTVQEMVKKAPMTAHRFNKLFGYYTGGNYVKINSINYI